jgi:hypothetical protein
MRTSPTTTLATTPSSTTLTTGRNYVGAVVCVCHHSCSMTNRAGLLSRALLLQLPHNVYCCLGLGVIGQWWQAARGVSFGWAVSYVGDGELWVVVSYGGLGVGVLMSCGGG